METMDCQCAIHWRAKVQGKAVLLQPLLLKHVQDHKNHRSLCSKCLPFALRWVSHCMTTMSMTCWWSSSHAARMHSGNSLMSLILDLQTISCITIFITHWTEVWAVSWPECQWYEARGNLHEQQCEPVSWWMACDKWNSKQTKFSSVVC